MIKIPVLDTIASAYRFTFEQLGAIIGLIWIPQLIVSVGSYVTRMPYNARLAAGDNLEAASSERMIAMAGEVLSIIMFAVIAVAVVRQALGLRKGPAIAYFAFGKAEMRVIASILALAAIATVFILGGALGSAAISGLAGKTGAAVAGVLLLIGAGALVYAMVRLSFLVVPASVSHGDYGIERSWTLTKGNFWRIVGVLLASVGPVSLLTVIAFLVIVGPDIFPSNPDILNSQADLQQFQTEQAKVLARNQPLLLGLAFAVAPFTFGLWFGAVASAFKTLSGTNSDRGTLA